MNKIITLSGKWKMRFDEEGKGINEHFYNQKFLEKTGILPGTNHTNFQGNTNTQGDLKGFSDLHPFKGCMWYQRKVCIDQFATNKEFILFLERCCWETYVWVNGKFAGTQNSLLSPHEYNLTTLFKTGANVLTIMVDNSNSKGTEISKGNELVKHYDLTQDVKDEAKLNCGGHHIWAHNFNGIIGKIELRVKEKIHIVRADVFCYIEESSINVKVLIANTLQVDKMIKIKVTVSAKKMFFECKLTGIKEEIFELKINFEEKVELWDEFNPVLYNLTLELENDKYDTTFGMRELKTSGVDMLLNGRKLFLRGTLEDFIYPLHGHVPTDLKFWKKEIATAKLYGLNFLRFHSCCPPEAAFMAADKLGMYLQVEVPGTSCPQKDEDKNVEVFLFDELKNILSYYGNHPSFLSVSMGNEQFIALDNKDFIERHKEVLHKKLRYGQTYDPRHLYTCTCHPWREAREDDFFVSAWAANSDEPLCGIKWSGGKVIDTSRFNTRNAETIFNYSVALKGLDRPLITHEVGQWAVYPDMREITRYHGAQRAYNHEIIRKDLEEKGLLDYAADFTRASGMLALILYREEVESALRTPELSGFMLLKLYDYPGQGTSSIGILNSLWESKGLTTPRKFTEFCSEFVPLARLKKYVWENNEEFKAEIEIANYSNKDFNDYIDWTLSNENGIEFASGHFHELSAPAGQLTKIGMADAMLNEIKEAIKMRFTICVAGAIANSYDIWVYPHQKAMKVPENVTFTTKWDNDVEQVLEQGGKVVYAPDDEDIKGSIPGTFTTVFWNPQMKHNQVSKTMGLLCDDAHPALNDFPTDFHSNYQWQDIVMHSSAMCIDKLPKAIRPIVRVIDSFVENKSLAMIFEVRCLNGSLLICSADISSSFKQRPVAKQLRYSLLEYANSDLFNPDVQISLEELNFILQI